MSPVEALSGHQEARTPNREGQDTWRRLGARSAAVSGACPGCLSVWSGRGVCHCRSCHQTFTEVEWFDQHKAVRDGCCWNPAELRSGGRPLIFVEGMWSGPR